jgi:hypothetical protein
MDDDVARRLVDHLSGSGVELSVHSDRLKLRYPIAAYMRWDGDLRGAVTYQVVGLAPPAPPPSNVCNGQRMLDLMGSGRTGADGTVTLHVRDYVCWDEWKIVPDDEVWVVATPRSSQPVYLTHVVQVPPVLGGPPPTPAELDVQLRVMAWDPSGQPVPDVFFTWRAVLSVSIPTDD